MASGNLGSLSPSATTSTKLYGCSVYNSTSSTINVCNRSASSASYRVAVKPYDQKVVLDGSPNQYNLRTGNIATMWSIDLQNSVSEVPYLSGEVVTTKDGFGSAKYFSKDADTATETYLVSVSSVTEIIVQEPTGGNFAVGDTVTDVGLTISGTITKLNGASVLYVVMTTGTFTEGTTLTNGTASAVIDTVETPTNLYFIDVQDGDGPQQTPSLTLYQGKTYVFDLSDASLASHPFALSTTLNGTHNGGSIYTTGVVNVGTPGNAGASLTLVVDSNTSSILYPFCTVHSGMYSDGNLLIQQSLYKTLYFYDITGSWSALDIITLGVNEVVIENVNIGPFGFIQNYSGNVLDISLSPSSPVSFTPLTTTITGTSGEFSITVGSADGLLVGMAVSGTGVGTGAIITEISGTTVTLSVENSGAVSGTGTFKYRILDTPQDSTDLVQSYVTIESVTTDVTGIQSSDYVVYDKTIDANTTAQLTGTVVGPGQSVVVYADSADLSFVMMGFTDNTDDFTIDFGALNS